MPREERGVDVQASVPGNIQERLWKNLAVGDDHVQVRSQSPDLFDEFLIASPLRLKDRDSQSNGSRLDGRRLQLKITAARLVRLGNDGPDFVLRVLCQRVEA